MILKLIIVAFIKIDIGQELPYRIFIPASFAFIFIKVDNKDA